MVRLSTPRSPPSIGGFVQAMSTFDPETDSHRLKRDYIRVTHTVASRDSAYYLAMQLADRSPTAPPSVVASAAQTLSSSNQKAYLRLKLALSLNLRRQIFLAVCDDLALRNRVAARLYAELAYPSSKSAIAEPQLNVIPHDDAGSRTAVAPADHLLLGRDDPGTPTTTEPISRLLYPRLVSLNLNLNDPNPMVQIGEWLAQYPPPKGPSQRPRTPGFQILGTERLTRQPAPIQKRFLTSLQQIEHYLSCLDSALLLWLPRPWFHAVQQSAPDFWNWHTALFEFEGDPTPPPALSVRPEAAASHQLTHSAPPIAAIATDPVDPTPAAVVHSLSSPAATPSVAVDRDRMTIPASEVTDGDLPMPTASLSEGQRHGSALAKDNLWAILTHDLAQLQDGNSPEPPASRLELPPVALDASDGNADASADYSTVSALSTAAAPEERLPDAAASVPVDESDRAVEVDQADVVAAPVDSEVPQNHAILELADLMLAMAASESNQRPSSEDAQIIQALQQIEQLHLQEAPTATLLAAYQNLGNICRDRVEQGNASPQQLLLTIRVHEQMLQWLDEDSSLWSDLLNDIGNLYWMLSRHGLALDESLSYLEQAIAVYQQALQKTNPQTRPNNYAMIQNNLGSAYGDRARFQDPAENLERSVQAYELALRYRKLADDPARYAATQNNLGTAYWNLAQHQQPIRRLKQSIAAYFEALRYYSPDCEPIHYAMIQNNLGTAYWNLAQQPQANLGVATATGKEISPTELLQRAITAYRAALVYRTLEVAPAAYAATQNNLGTAYWQLASLMDRQPEQRQPLLQQAIAAYRSAIAAVQYLAAASTVHAPALSFDPAATHNNLGLAYYQLATDKHHQDDSKQRFAHLESALRHHLQALQGWEPQSELYQTVFSYVVQTVRAFHNEFGSKGQTQALSQVPANLLPAVLKQL